MLLRAGNAFVFDLQHELHCEENLPAALNVFLSAEVMLRVYSPFALYRTHRPGDEVDLKLIPFIADTRPPAESLPTLEAHGTTTWPTPSIIANAVRIDVYGITDIENATDTTTRFVREFTQWVRWTCRQWWIGVGHSEATSPLALSFPIDGAGQGQGTLHSHVAVMPWLRGECRLTPALFHSCAQLAANGQVVPLAGRLLLDGFEAFLHQRYPQSALLLAQSVECAVDAVLSEAVKAGALRRPVRRKVLQLEFGPRLDEGLHEAFGHSFLAADPDSYAALCRLWVLRHAVAHADVAQLARRTPEFAIESMNTISRSVAKFFEWLAEARQVPNTHWLAPCLRPIIV